MGAVEKEHFKDKFFKTKVKVGSGVWPGVDKVGVQK